MGVGVMLVGVGVAVATMVAIPTIVVVITATAIPTIGDPAWAFGSASKSVLISSASRALARRALFCLSGAGVSPLVVPTL